MSVLLEYTCPRCLKKNEDASAMGPDGEKTRPSHGDIALCLACAAPLRMRTAMPPEWLTYDQMVELRKTADPKEFAQLLMTIIAIITFRPSTLITKGVRG